MMRTLALFCINQQTKFEMLIFTISENMIGAKLKKNGSPDPDHASFRSGYWYWIGLDVEEDGQSYEIVKAGQTGDDRT